jgi:PilZ domain
MQPERRCIPRERPEELSYIQFDPAGGGIVVNASEQGLAFQTTTALRQLGPIQLCVSPNPMQRIKLSAEIAWMDQTNKFGGLRFTELSADARNQIRQWLRSTRNSGAPDRKFVEPPCAPNDELDPCSEARKGTPDLLPPTPTLDNTLPACVDATTLSAARLCSIPSEGLSPAPASQEKQIFISRPRLLRGFALGFLILVLAFVPTLFVHDFRRQIGSMLIRMGEILEGNPVAEPDRSPSVPVQVPKPDSGSASLAPNPIPETAPNGDLKQSDPVSSSQTIQRTAASADSQLSERQNSGKQLGNSDAKRGRSALARQLWSALGAGDSSAGVALAQLYLTGDGVPRNCEQARVLLMAASKKGSLEALQKLRRLNKSACRQP